MVWQLIFGTRKRENVSSTISKEITNFKRPRTIYRYCPINENICKTFREKRLYFPTYEKLNDPCEGFYDVHFEWDEENIRASFRMLRDRPVYRGTRSIIEEHHGSGAAIIAEGMLKLSEDQYVNRIRDLYDHVGNSKNEDFKDSQRIIDLKNIRILSLTEKSDSIFMCYVYADRNKGVCLEFNTNNEPFKMIVPVIYRENPLIWNPLGGDQQQTVARMCVKHTDWAMEKEWRIVGHTSEMVDIEYQPFEIESLKSVTFCRDTPENKKLELLGVLDSVGWKCKIGVNVFRFSEDKTRSSYGIIRKKAL